MREERRQRAFRLWDEQEKRFRAALFIALDDFLLADPLQLHSALCAQRSSEAANKSRMVAREQYNPNTTSIFRLDGPIVLLVSRPIVGPRRTISHRCTLLIYVLPH